MIFREHLKQVSDYANKPYQVYTKILQDCIKAASTGLYYLDVQINNGIKEEVIEKLKNEFNDLEVYETSSGNSRTSYQISW